MVIGRKHIHLRGDTQASFTEKGGGVWKVLFNK